MAGNSDDEESACMEVEGVDTTGASGLGQQDEAAMDGAHMEEVSIFSTVVVDDHQGHNAETADTCHPLTVVTPDRGHIWTAAEDSAVVCRRHISESIDS